MVKDQLNNIQGIDVMQLNKRENIWLEFSKNSIQKNRTQHTHIFWCNIQLKMQWLKLTLFSEAPAKHNKEEQPINTNFSQALKKLILFFFIILSLITIILLYTVIYITKVNIY